MIHKNWIILGFACLLLATSANAEIALIEPLAGSTNETTIFQGQNATIEITIENTSNKTITGIIPQTDLNAKFSKNSFGLDPGKQKTTTATIYTTENTEGTIAFGNQSFAVKITVIEEQNTLAVLQEKWNENTGTILIILLVASTITIGLLMRKAK